MFFVSPLSTSLSQIREIDLTGFRLGYNGIHHGSKKLALQIHLSNGLCMGYNGIHHGSKKTCFADPFEHWTVHVTNEMQNGPSFFLPYKSKDDI